MNRVSVRITNTELAQSEYNDVQLVWNAFSKHVDLPIRTISGLKDIPSYVCSFLEEEFFEIIYEMGYRRFGQRDPSDEGYIEFYIE